MPKDTPEILHVIVSVASVKHSKEFDFPETELVGTAADVAARAFGITPEQPPAFQNAQDRVLSRNQTLEAAGVKNDAHLELVAGGGGV